MASSAYRSGTRLVDERTGVIHDYSRKGGVLHHEILAPENTPHWMLDRGQLWNAVETIERRKDAQLSREIQLSLPHELTHEQRLELARGFVQEQFVDKGMIADVAIHAPDKNGDQRNHHAHIMLTMRNLTQDGFDKKNRDWNNKDLLQSWRQEWANHQNRDLEKYGHDARVDHRSYLDQGIDREPQQHLGTHASDMKRKGKPSRIVEENDAIEKRNAMRASHYARLAQEAAAMSRKNEFEQAATRKRNESLAQSAAAKRQMEARHKKEIAAFNDWKAQNGRQTIKQEIKATQERLETTGIKKVVRDVLGRTTADKQALIDLKIAAKQLKEQENTKQLQLEIAQQREREQFQHKAKRQQEQQKAQEKKRQVSQSRSERSGDNRSLKPRTRKEDQPKPEPPPPREALSIAQSWAEKSGQNARRVSEAVQARKIDTSKMKIAENEPSKPAKPDASKQDIAQSWAEKSGQQSSQRANDNKPKRTLTPKRPRGLER
ncbi:MAG: MobA/MobL family protein [Gammaproteobacteria bacterium]|nr:MobA/MobL family protein [Gammaproteobacteria bacterium]